MGQRWAKFCKRGRQFVQIGFVCRSWPDFGPRPAKLGCSIGQSIGRRPPIIVSSWCVARPGSSLARCPRSAIGPKLGRIGQHWSNSGRSSAPGGTCWQPLLGAALSLQQLPRRDPQGEQLDALFHRPARAAASQGVGAVRCVGEGMGRAGRTLQGARV